MRSLMFDAPGHARMYADTVPRPGPDEVLVEAELSLVSVGTERGLLLHSASYPVAPGYSMVGTIAAVGTQVRGLAVGDRVIANAAHASHALCHRDFVLPIPAGLSSSDAAFFNVGAMAIHAVRLAGLRLGDPLLILGQGLIGLIATQVARLAGALPIVTTDVHLTRLDQSLALGADYSFLAEQREDAEALLASLPGGGPAATIELSGVAQTIDMALATTRRKGRVVAASLVQQGYDVNIYGRAWLEGISIIGAYFNARPWRLAATDTSSPLDWPIRPVAAGTSQDSDITTGLGDIALFLRLAQAGRLSLKPLVEEVVPAADAPAFFDSLAHRQPLGVLIQWL